MTSLFMSLASAMILLGLAALWQSLRAALGGGVTSGGDLAAGLPERKALEAEKRTLLRTIKDIQFDRELGKLSEEDFTRLDRAYRRRAKRVLALLDHDIEPHLERARSEIAQAVDGALRGNPRRRSQARHGARAGAAESSARSRASRCPACGVDNDLDATACEACGTRLAPRRCVSCGTDNDPDARFCKSCAASLTGDVDDEE